MVLKHKYENWFCEKDDNNIFWLYIDKANTNTNVLSKNVLEELNLIIDELKEIKEPTPRGLVICSSKKKGFIAGADIKEFVDIKDKKSGLELVKRGQEIMNAIEKLPFTTVAAINGFCLGGGMELALACDFRVADNSSSTKLGLPEVKLGIHPGFGGTFRATKLIGCFAAMDMMLTGRMLSPGAAKKIGLINMAVPAIHLKRGAQLIILTPPKLKGLGWKNIVSHKIVRPYVAKMLRKKVSAKANKDHYPAPYAIIDLWEREFDNSTRMYAEEAKSISNLIISQTSKNLVKVFLLQEKIKSIAGAEKAKIFHIHVIGAGIMGGDIAAWSALKGYTVTLQDREPKYIAPAVKRAHKLFKKRLKENRLVQAAMDRLIPDAKGEGVFKADLVIEAIFEDLEVKRKLFKDLEERVGKNTILASNTSSIPIEEIAEILKKPERLVGIHFFNPVSKMMLVEIVKSKSTSEETSKSAISYVHKIGKLPLPVKSTPGFLVNRILMPYLLEGVRMVGEGIEPEIIDKAAVDFGMPMGPIILADTVGLDICLHVSRIFSKYFNFDIPKELERKVEENNIGKKSGKGFYDYKKDKLVKNKVKTHKDLTEITDRLIFSFLNESVACLRESVIEKADFLDGGLIFGTGFAPFRGGPVNYIKDQNHEYFPQKFKSLERKYGSRFKMDEGWTNILDN